jgi:hypothetical protein
LSLFFGVTCANDFRDLIQISLQKDEQKKILVKYASNEKLFTLRWTLYHNDGLVVLRSYDRVVAQNILYLESKNQSFRLDLKPSGADFYNTPYFLVKFKEFDYETNRAFFDIYLSDKKMMIELKVLE